MTNNINLLRFLTFVRNDILPIGTQSLRGNDNLRRNPTFYETGRIKAPRNDLIREYLRNLEKPFCGKEPSP
jgi:hypothetical protein